jgi:hypothetical protein
VRAVLDSTAGKDATAGNLPVAEFPFTPAAALFTTDEGGVLAGITMFVLSPTGSGGSIVPITVNSDVGFDDAARRSVRSVFAEEGPEAAVFAVESLLLVSVEYSAVEGPSELTSMLAAHEPYQVTLASPVVAEQDADSRSQAFDCVARPLLNLPGDRDPVWSTCDIEKGVKQTATASERNFVAP